MGHNSLCSTCLGPTDLPAGRYILWDFVHVTYKSIFTETMATTNFLPYELFTRYTTPVKEIKFTDICIIPFG